MHRSETTSLNDLVCKSQERRRHFEAKRLGGLEADDQLELCRLLDGQLGGVLAFEDAVDISGLAALSVKVGSSSGSMLAYLLFRLFPKRPDDFCCRIL